MLQFQNGIIHMTIPGIDVYLTNFFWDSILDRPRRPHSHASYELVCIDSEQKKRIIINPPLYEHMSADAPNKNVKSFLFSLIPGTNDRICETFKGLKEPIEIVDDFGGNEFINSFRVTLDSEEFGVRERAAAELWMFFIELAKIINIKSNGEAGNVSQTIDEERIARINDFFHIYLSDPSCCKEQLASYIGVSERHLSRILNKIYGMKFSSILNKMRMDIAESMREEGSPIDDIMKVTGFLSFRTFQYNYKTFFGKPFKKKK